MRPSDLSFWWIETRDTVEMAAKAPRESVAVLVTAAVFLISLPIYLPLLILAGLKSDYYGRLFLMPIAYVVFAAFGTRPAWEDWGRFVLRSTAWRGVSW